MNQVLISFCNTRPKGLPLGRYDFETGEFAWIDAASDLEGATGLAFAGDGFHVLLQQKHASGCDTALAWLDPNLQLTRVRPLELVRDGHSLIVHEGALLAVSTGSNSVVRIEPDGEGKPRENVFWSATDAAGDAVHVNSIAVHEGELYVSMFGPRTGSRWEGSRSGQVWNISRGEMVCDGLAHPHTLFDLSGRLCCVNSQTAEVLEIASSGPVERWQLEGYARGVAVNAEHLYVGASAFRKRSKSTGSFRASSGNGRDARCLLFRIDLASGAIETRDLTCFGPEIYDVALLPPAFSQPFAPREDALARRVALFDREHLDLLERHDAAAAANIAYTFELHRLINDDQNFLAAAFVLERLVARDGSNADWQYHYGFCLLQLGAPERAIVHLEKALELGFYEFWCRYNLAGAHLRAGSAQAAREEFARAAALRPEGVDISPLAFALEEASKTYA